MKKRHGLLFMGDWYNSKAKGSSTDSMEWEVGSIVPGRVTGITKFGAFVALGNGKSGLVHISEVSGSFVNDVHDFLSEGQEVQVKVLSVTPEGKINLSIKQAQPQSVSRPRPARAPHAAGSAVAAAAAEPTFEDKLKQFLSASDSKQSEFNRHMAGKRGGRRRK
jgi:S1 RNA binding domain protein